MGKIWAVHQQSLDLKGKEKLIDLKCECQKTYPLFKSKDRLLCMIYQINFYDVVTKIPVVHKFTWKYAKRDQIYNQNIHIGLKIIDRGQEKKLQIYWPDHLPCWPHFRSRGFTWRFLISFHVNLCHSLTSENCSCDGTFKMESEAVVASSTHILVLLGWMIRLFFISRMISDGRYFYNSSRQR